MLRGQNPSTPTRFHEDPQKSPPAQPSDDPSPAGRKTSAPKSRRSRRDLPLPAELAEALHALKIRHKAEALALGVGWCDDRLIAVREDGEPLRPEFYTDEFHRLRCRAGLRRTRLHGLRNTSGTLMLDQNKPVHIVAAWHGHDPAVLLSIYSDARPTNCAQRARRCSGDQDVYIEVS